MVRPTRKKPKNIRRIASPRGMKRESRLKGKRERQRQGKAADGHEYSGRLPPPAREADQRGHDNCDPGTPGDLDRRMIGGDVGLGFRPDQSLPQFRYARASGHH